MRSEVMWFANQMEKKLNRRIASKDGWHACKIRFMLSRLLDEAIELIEACRYKARNDGDPNEVIDECVDVANFAMMIADRMKSIEERR